MQKQAGMVPTLVLAAAYSLFAAATAHASPPRTVGEQKSSDTIGGPGTRTSINDGARGPKEHSGPRRNTDRDGGTVTQPKTPPVAKKAPPPAPGPAMDAQALLSALETVVEFQKGRPADDSKLGKYVGGRWLAESSWSHLVDSLSRI